MKSFGGIKIVITGIILVAFVLQGSSQDTIVKDKFSFGGEGAIKMYNGGLFARYTLMQPLTISLEYTDGLYFGSGIGAGLIWKFLQKAKFNPVLSIFYLRSIGSGFSYDRDNGDYTVFKTKDANYIVPMIG